MKVMSEGSGLVLSTGSVSAEDLTFWVMVLEDSQGRTCKVTVTKWWIMSWVTGDFRKISKAWSSNQLLQDRSFVGTVRLGLVLAVQQNDVLGPVVELLSEERLQDVLGALRVSDLGVNDRARVVRSHGIASTVLVGHGSPWVVLWSWLWEPHVSTVSSKLSALDGGCNVLGHADGTSGGVDEPGALLEVLEQLCVHQALRAGVQWTVDRDNVGLGNQLLDVVDSAGADFLLRLFRQRLVVVVEQLLRVEGHKSLQHTVADSACSDGGNDLALDVEGVLGDLGHVPAARDDLLVSRNKVPHQHQHRHHNVLGNRNDVRTGHLQHRNVSAGLVDVVKVDVVGSHSGNHQ
ncbi:hypothetical protein OGATHE_005374 [Ogataea polymorpha]|uniref:Uncharacterized protein n=1 Tax=Ogataea polymorpha TaxID=460523 RepID=A0A9P8NX48_9ASCO|nr:hypothetical protein OGATHE_005374 [Ogataea polymorpha]